MYKTINTINWLVMAVIMAAMVWGVYYLVEMPSMRTIIQAVVAW